MASIVRGQWTHGFYSQGAVDTWLPQSGAVGTCFSQSGGRGTWLPQSGVRGHIDSVVREQAGY